MPEWTTSTGKLIPKENVNGLLEVLCHAVLIVRNSFSKIPKDQVIDLMDAVHNIPIFLQEGGDNYWETVQSDLTRYDERYGSKDFSGLMSVYRRGIEKFSE